MRVLVTGSAGFIGRHLASRLGGKGLKVIGADRRRCDLTRREGVRRLMRSVSPDVVVHAAGSLDDRGAGGARERYFNNVVSTANVLDSSIESGVKKIVFLSSNAVYGESYRVRAANAASSDPRSAYSRAKKVCEDILRDHADEIEIVVLRLPFVVGPGKKTSDLITDIIGALSKGRAFKIYGRGASGRQFLDIDDLIEVVRLCAARKPKGSGFLLVPAVGGRPKSIATIARAVAAARGGGSIEFDRVRRDAPGQSVDPTIAKKLLGWSARTTLEESIRKML